MSGPSRRRALVPVALGAVLAGGSLSACGSSRNSASNPNQPTEVAPAKFANGELPASSGPTTPARRPSGLSNAQVQALLLSTTDLATKLRRGAPAAVSLATCNGPVLPVSRSGPSAATAFYAAGRPAPAVVEQITAYGASPAAAAFADAQRRLSSCRSLTVQVGAARLAGPLTATGPVVPGTPSLSYQANLGSSSLHAGLAVLHEHTVDIVLAFLTWGAPDPQTLKADAARALTKVQGAGI